MLNIRIDDQGSIVIFTPLDDVAREWLRENVEAEPRQWRGDNLMVDHRMAQVLADAIEEN